MLDTLVLIGSDSQPIFRGSRLCCFAPVVALSSHRHTKSLVFFATRPRPKLRPVRDTRRRNSCSHHSLFGLVSSISIAYGRVSPCNDPLRRQWIMRRSAWLWRRFVMLLYSHAISDQALSYASANCVVLTSPRSVLQQRCVHSVRGKMDVAHYAAADEDILDRALRSRKQWVSIATVRQPLRFVACMPIHSPFSIPSKYPCSLLSL